MEFCTLAFRAGPFRICGGQGGTGINLSQITSFYNVTVIPTVF